MGWGDFDCLYKVGDERTRQRQAIQGGLLPGTLVRYGSEKKVLTMWKGPDFKSDCFNLYPGLAIVIRIDCEDDPMNDWLFLFINTQEGPSFGWLPSELVKAA